MRLLSFLAPDGVGVGVGRHELAELEREYAEEELSVQVGVDDGVARLRRLGDHDERLVVLDAMRARVLAALERAPAAAHITFAHHAQVEVVALRAARSLAHYQRIALIAYVVEQ